MNKLPVSAAVTQAEGDRVIDGWDPCPPLEIGTGSSMHHE